MIRQVIAGSAIAAAALVATASSASAHGGQDGERPSASNYRTTITEVSPSIPGVEVRVLEAGARIELRNDTAEEAVVLGYQGEPYLRVGPRGVYENVRSPATYLNADRRGRTEIPTSADPDAAPEWRKVNGSQVARWHDHRAHWMGDDDPPAVAADRDRTQVVMPDWVIPLELDGRRISIIGDLTWVPGPSRWPWLAGSLAVGAVTFAAARRRPWPTLVASASVLLVSSVVEAAGVWAEGVESSVAKASQLAVPVAAWTLLIGGLVAYRRSPRDGVMLVGGAATGLAWLFGLADLSWLGASQLPTAVPPHLARVAIAASLGLGGALLAFAVVHTRAVPAFTGPAREPLGAAAASVSRGAEDRLTLRHHRRVLLGGVAVLAILGVVVTAPDRDAEGPPAALTVVHRDLCTVLARSATEPVEASAMFGELVHDPLHDLAAATQVRDQSGAAELVEAEQRVERVIASDPSRVAPELARLEPTVRQAVGALGGPIAPCEGREP